MLTMAGETVAVSGLENGAAPQGAGISDPPSQHQSENRAGPPDLAMISATLSDVLVKVHIDAGQVGRVFDWHKPASLHESAASITGGAKSEAEMVRRLVEAAQKTGFLNQFILGVHYLVSVASSATTADAGKILSLAPGSVGFMQAIMDANRGLASFVTLGKLFEACASIGCLVDREKPATSFGTVFLVADDVVLTCAHVVEAAAAQIGAAAEENRKAAIPKQVMVKFPNVEVMKRAQDAVEANLHADWDQLPSSPPFGQPPLMEIVNGKASEEKAAAHLDYAFLRLANRPHNLTPLNIVSPPTPRETGLNAVIGFPNGGLACCYDSLNGQQYVATAARINYLMNAMPGMSGSPCLDSDGKVYGLHEGTVKPGSGQPYNRAISMERVVASLKAEGAARLFTRRAAKLWLDDPEARRSWAQSGLLLAGDNGDDWIAKVEAVGDPPPNSLQPAPSLHPIFPRNDVTGWVERALSPSCAERLLLIGGQFGAGKTFCRHILAGALPADFHRMVYLPHDSATNPDRLAVNAALRKAALIRPPADTLSESVRPIPGRVTHDEVGPLVQDLVPVAGSGMLWLFIDFRRGDSWVGETKAFWTSFAAQATAEPSLRLIYVGLKPAARNDLRQVTRAAEVSINPPTDQELRDYIAALVPARAPGRQASEAPLAQEISDALNAYDDSRNEYPRMATVEAVRLIILLASLL